MRDANRIRPFCEQLAELWSMVPDWRFGQLIYNVMWKISNDHHVDMFYIEDDKMLQYIKSYFELKEEEQQNGVN